MRGLVAALSLALASGCSQAASISVEGTVRDQRGRPAADVSVAIPGHGAVHTDDGGRFAFSRVEPPYDIAVLSHSGYPIEYRGVSRDDPHLVVTRYAACDMVSVELHGSVTLAAGGESPLTGTAGIDAEYSSSAIIQNGSFVVHSHTCDEPLSLWALVRDASGEWLFAITTVHPSIDGAIDDEGIIQMSRSLALEPIGASSVTIRLGDLPEGFVASQAATLSMSLGGIRVGTRLATLDEPMSVPPEASIDATIDGLGPEDELGDRAAAWSTYRHLVAGDSVELPLVRAPELVTPRMIPDANGDTELGWSAAGAPSVYAVTVMPWWHMDGSATTIITADRSILLREFPEVSGPGWQWFVESFGERRSVDELLDPDPPPETLAGRTTTRYLNAAP